MSIVKTYQSEFQIHCYDEDLNRSHEMTAAMEKAGFDFTGFNSRGLFMESLETSVPHVFLLFYQPLSLAFREMLQKVRETSTEVEVVIMATPQYYPGVQKLIDMDLADDFWVWPQPDEKALAMRLEKLLETFIYKFIAEQKSEVTEKIVNRLDQLEAHSFFKPVNPAQNTGSDLGDILENSQKDESGLIEDFLNTMQINAPKSDFIYLKNYPARNQLLVTKTSFSTEDSFRGQSLPFSQEQLKEDRGETFASLRRVLEETFHCQEFMLQPVELADDLYGFVMAINFDNASYLKKSARYLSLAIRNSKLEEEGKKPEQDVTLDLDVRRQQFPLALSREISRARRLKLPISLVICHMDYVADQERERTAVMDLIRNNLRDYDFVSELDDQKVAIVMPHCKYEDAAIKAETIRRQMVARGLKKQNAPLRLCFGVSEFPALSMDSVSLMADATRACDQVLVSGKNKVCLYTATEDHIVEFQPTL